MQTLRKRLSYNEMVNYIENDKEKIKFPNRQATFLRNSHFLSQFDGDSFIDLEEEENKMNRERLKEDEIKKISSETKTTAQVNRATRRMKVPRRISKKSAPSQAQSDNEAEETKQAAPPNTSTPQYFDMTVDDETDKEMHNVDVEAERRKEQEKKKKKKAAEIVSRHLGEDVRDLPYLQEVSSSSTSKPSYIPMATDLPAEDTSRGRGRPPTKVKTNDGGENTTQKRTRKTPQEPKPMIVNSEGDQQKRAKKESASSSEKKKRRTKEEKHLLKIQAAEEREAKRDEKLENKVVKEVKKSKAKGVEPKSGTVIHGVDLIENKNKSFWKQQNITVLKQQAESRGHRFTDEETKGGNRRVNGVMTKFKKFKKEDYLDTLLKILKI
jgi:hypothetical protein